METQDIRDYIIRQFRPSCIVYSSHTAEKMCAENNLSPAEFLRPFMDMRKEKLIISPPNKAPSYVLRDFVFDLYDAADYERLPASEHISARKQVLASNPPYFSFNDPPTVDVKDLRVRRTSWYDLWRYTFLELNRVQNFELLQQPFALITLLSSEEDLNSGILEALSKKPEICEKHFDTEVPKILFLLVPGNAEAKEKVVEIYENIRKQMPTFRVFILPINSLKFTNEKLMDDIWAPYIKMYSQKGGFKHSAYTERGFYISKAERKEIQEKSIEAVRTIILPTAEKKYATLYRIALPPSRWGGFLGGEATASYPSDSRPGRADWELRYAADMAFLMQDYGSAVKIYNKLFEKLKKTRQFLDLGSCKEFLTLATLIAEPSRRDFTKNMEVVLDYYVKGNNLNMVTRNVIFSHDIFSLVRRFSDSASYLNVASSCLISEAEIPALLYEQIAFTMVRENPPQLRKFACLMFCSGKQYLKHGLLANAIYCLGTCYNIYDKPNWPEILLSLCDQLGSALTDKKEYEHAFNFFRKLLDVSITFLGESNQEDYLQKVLASGERLKTFILSENYPSSEEEAIEEKKTKIFEKLKMQSSLKILPETVEIFTSQDEIYCNDLKKLYLNKYDMSLKKHVLVLPGEQDDTEPDIVPIAKLYNKPQSWLVLGKIIDGDLADPYEGSTNPKHLARNELFRDLYFHDEKMTKRKCIMYTKRKRITHIMEPVYIKFRCQNPLKTNLTLSLLKTLCHYSSISTSMPSPVDIATLSISFTPNELKEIILSILPKAEGDLVIEGLTWEIGSLINGQYFSTQVTGKIDPITLEVRGKAGNLFVSTDGNLRTTYLDGEVDSYVLKMKNIGALPVSEITLQTDYPLLLGWKTKMLDVTLKPQEEHQIRIHVRAGFIEGSIKGSEALMSRILIRYKSDESTSDTEDPTSHFRYKRLEHVFSVEPSFVIKDSCIRSFKNLNEYLLNVQIEKIFAKQEKFSLNQLSIVGSNWQIFEKQQFAGFDKVFNAFISLVFDPEAIISLDSKRIILCNNADEPKEDLTLIEPYSSYINEYQEVRASLEAEQNLTVTSVNVLATWSMERSGKKLQGAHILPITLSSYKAAQAVSKGPSKLDIFPLQIVHECPYRIRHDFSKEPICKVPLKLRVKNSSFHTARFRFEALGIQRDVKAKSNNFLWQGPSTKNISALEPNEQCEIYLEASIMNYGVYDLNRFSFAFFRHPSTGEDLDPAHEMPKNLALKMYALENDQIFVTVSLD